MKFLVTGAAGFIGSHLVIYLLSVGHTVVGIDNMSEGFEENIIVAKDSENYTFINIDILDYPSLNAAMRDVDYVMHQAGLGSVPRSIEQPDLYNSNNIMGTYNVLKSAHEQSVKRVVFASSSSVYGDTKELPKHEEILPRPLNPYALSKLTGEYYCKIFSLQYGLETVSLRYFNVFGPRQNPDSQYAAVIPKFLTKILNSENIEIYGDGEQTRDFTYISNVVSANYNACFSETVTFGDAYNVGSGESVSVNQLINEIKTNMKQDVSVDYKEIRKGDVKDSVANIDKARAAGLVIEPIDLSTGIEMYIKEFIGANK